MLQIIRKAIQNYPEKNTMQMYKLIIIKVDQRSLMTVSW